MLALYDCNFSVKYHAWRMLDACGMSSLHGCQWPHLIAAARILWRHRSGGVVYYNLIALCEHFVLSACIRRCVKMRSVHSVVQVVALATPARGYGAVLSSV
jgi:hypothetical protein